MNNDSVQQDLNGDSLRSQAAITAAAAEGKRMQIRYRFRDEEFKDCDVQRFNFAEFEYRVRRPQEGRRSNRRLQITCVASMKNQESLQYQQSIIQAAINGKKIQLREKIVDPDPWQSKAIYPGVTFDFCGYEYRIVQEPEEVFINIYSWGRGAHDTKEEAETQADKSALRVAVKFREVIEDEQL